MKRSGVVALLVVLVASLILVSPSGAAPNDYIVQPGDTLFTIAQQLLGDGYRYSEIVELTNIKSAIDPSYAHIADPRLLRVGWKLAIPAGMLPQVAVNVPNLITDLIPRGAKPKGVLEAVAKVDDYTVKLRFYRYPTGLLAQLATPMMGMHSPAAVESWGPEYLYHPVGTGPYLFRAWTLGNEVILDANPDYWGDKARIARLIYRAIPEPLTRTLELITGTVDFAYRLTPSDLVTASAQAPLVTYQVPPINVGYLAINRDWKDASGAQVLADVRVRQAIAHAIDKERLVKQLFPGTGLVAKSFLPPVIWGYNKDFPDYNYNPARARQLLAEAGYPQGFKTQLWVLPLGRSYFPEPLKVAQEIQADLAAVGIEATLVTDLDWETYLSRVDAGEAPLCLMGWTPDYLDPDDTLYSLFGTGRYPTLDGVTKQFAQAGVPDAGLYALLSRARLELDPAVREQLYREAEAIVHGVVPGVPIVHNGTLAVSRSGLSDYHPAPLYDTWSTVSYTTSTLTIARPGDPEGLDVADEIDADSLAIGAQIFEGLVAFEPGTSRLKPALAERWEVSPDGLEWTFYLRKGVKFQDGTDFNADAVLFNIDRVWDRQHPFRAGHTQSFHYFAWFFGGFKGDVTD